jgi:cell division protein FtsQ
MSLLMKIVSVCIGVFIFITPLLVSIQSNKGVCTGVEISISDSSRHHFITEDDIMNLIRSTGISITGVPVNELPLNVIESKIKTFDELRQAEVYISADNKMHVYVNQREPVMRVVASYGGDFFIDSEGVIMRRHNLYTPNLPILEIDMVFIPDQMTRMSVYDSEKLTNLAKAFELVDYIRGNSFWNSMIDQLSMSRDGRVTLIPRAGNHVIMMGRVENYEEKLNNLQAFYRQAMPIAGWDRYRVVNIEYKGQVVCQRR